MNLQGAMGRRESARYLDLSAGVLKLLASRVNGVGAFPLPSRDRLRGREDGPFGAGVSVGDEGGGGIGEGGLAARLGDGLGVGCSGSEVEPAIGAGEGGWCSGDGVGAAAGGTSTFSVGSGFTVGEANW